jgi:hypothetical protein
MTKWILSFVTPEVLVKVLTEYLSGLLAGTIKNPSSDKAQMLFKALEALLSVINRVLVRREEARIAAETTGRETFWSA